MRTSRLVLPVLAVAAAVAALPAGAAPKEVKDSYDVTVPLPFPMNTSVPTGDGCYQGQETLHKNSKAITLPFAGTFKAEVTYTGDWDLYLFDAKGAKLAAAETDETGSTGEGTEKLTYKKAKAGQEVTLVACNWLGLAEATVSYVLTAAK